MPDKSCTGISEVPSARQTHKSFPHAASLKMTVQYFPAVSLVLLPFPETVARSSHTG